MCVRGVGWGVNEVCFGNVQKDLWLGADGHEIECNADTEFTSAVLQKTGTSCTDGNISFWRKTDACPSRVFHASSFGTDAPCCE